MIPKFWQERWFEGRIGFHNPDVNPLLIAYFSALNLPKGSRVLVPLCGKSVDSLWLVEQGYDVIGIELVESAIQDFFAEQNITPTIDTPTTNTHIKRYQADSIDSKLALWVADIFALTTDDIGDIDAVYDRAALIAMPPEMRQKYSEQVKYLSNCAPQLLITIDYDQREKKGPPFSVSGEQVQHYYDNEYKITELTNQSATLNNKTKLAVIEQVWLLD